MNKEQNELMVPKSPKSDSKLPLLRSDITNDPASGLLQSQEDENNNLPMHYGTFPEEDHFTW